MHYLPTFLCDLCTYVVTLVTVVTLLTVVKVVTVVSSETNHATSLQNKIAQPLKKVIIFSSPVLFERAT